MAQAEFFMLVCKEDKANKFWTYDISQNINGQYVFQATFGRIGHKGQTATKTFRCLLDAQIHANHKIREKATKGYSQVNEDEYRFLCLLAEIVGAGNKVEEAAIVIPNPDAFAAYEVKPQVLSDPTIKPSFIIGIRLRDKNGATEPYYFSIDDRHALLLGHVERTEYLRVWQPNPLLKREHVVAHWSWIEQRTINSSHKLAPLIEKAEQVIGHALLS